MRALSRTRQKRSRDEWIQWTQGLNIKCQPRDHSDCGYEHQAVGAWQLWRLQHAHAMGRDLLCRKGISSAFPLLQRRHRCAAVPPTPHGSPEHAAAAVTAQLPRGQAGTAGTKPRSMQSSLHGCSHGFWGQTAVAEATIHSTCCLLLLIIKFCILLVMLPSEKLPLHK